MIAAWKLHKDFFVTEVVAQYDGDNSSRNSHKTALEKLPALIFNQNFFNALIKLPKRGKLNNFPDCDSLS